MKVTAFSTHYWRSIWGSVHTYLGGYITYQTFTGSPQQFEVRLQTVDTGQHTVSGTFAGIYYKGCDKVTISDGQFNLPYVDKP